jgi:hypothetical protein
MNELGTGDGFAQLQSAFADAIFFGDAPIPAAIRSGSGHAHASRFGVYRNNVVASLINAIAARYPIVQKLMCEDTFGQLVRLYVTIEPPRSPVLLEYGDSFPQFLRNVGQTTSAEYLADIAELESVRTRAYHSPDATPLSSDVFRAIDPERAADLRFVLHPSLQLLSSRFPMVSIWEANMYGSGSSFAFWQPEYALIARPHFEVKVRRLTLGAYQFFSALAKQCTLGVAIEHGKATTSHFDLAECFEALIFSEVVVGLQPLPDLPAAVLRSKNLGLSPRRSHSRELSNA